MRNFNWLLWLRLIIAEDTHKKNNINKLQAEEEEIGSRNMELMNEANNKCSASLSHSIIIIIIGVLNDQHLPCGAMRITTTTAERDNVSDAPCVLGCMYRETLGAYTNEATDGDAPAVTLPRRVFVYVTFSLTSAVVEAWVSCKCNRHTFAWLREFSMERMKSDIINKWPAWMWWLVDIEAYAIRRYHARRWKGQRNEN